MVSKQWIRKRAARGIQFVRGLSGGNSPEPIPGIPPGLTPSILDDVCREEMAESLTSTAYVHLSGWKETGSYRLHLTTSSGRRWRVIYKNASYRLDQIPALEGLPLKPGPPEYVVYAHAIEPLAAYLPHVYYAHEPAPGVQFQYIMEDLGQGYRRASEAADRLRVVEELPTIHRAMADWLSSVDDRDLLRYDAAFSSDLLTYTHTNLVTYADKTDDETAQEALARWTKIADVYENGLSVFECPAIPIHGDSNPANVMISRTDPTQLKLIDWEWAGIGFAHADLASLLKRSPSMLEAQALERYAQYNDMLTLAEHRRLYEWCQLQRGLLDIGFVARQHLTTVHDTRVNLVKYVHKSLNRTLMAVERLQRY